MSSTKNNNQTLTCFRFQKGGSLRDVLHGANPAHNYLRKYGSPKKNQVALVCGIKKPKVVLAGFAA